MPMCVQKMQRMALALTLSEQYHKDGDEFLKHIFQVTVHETWISFVDVKTNEESNQWMHTRSPDKLKGLNKRLPARKLMATLYWDRKAVLMVESMQQGTTAKSEVNC
jgi:hypothetical protein